MRIVILDGYTVNPGDNPWTALEEIGDLTVYERTDACDIVARSLGADIVITNKTPLRAETLDALPDLRMVGILATGYDVVDVEHAGILGIPVVNVVNYGADAVAQHCMALLLELCRRVALHDRLVREGRWEQCPDFCFWEGTQMELCGKTMGILGFGTIGRKVGALAHAFGMNILAASARKSGAELAKSAIDPGYPVTYVDCEELFAASDVISLHTPLSDATRGIVNEKSLVLMKDGAILLNVARGPLLDEEAVARALACGKLAGLGCDVVSKEPITSDNPLLHAPNTFITPHIAWASLPARQNILRILADNIKSCLSGKPKSVVNAAFLKTR